MRKTVGVGNGEKESRQGGRVGGRKQTVETEMSVQVRKAEREHKSIRVNLTCVGWNSYL